MEIGAGDAERGSLCETLDRVLNKGAVVVGEVTISVADIDLIYLGLQVILTSVETGRTLGAMMLPVGARVDHAGAEAVDGSA